MKVCDFSNDWLTKFDFSNDQLIKFMIFRLIDKILFFQQSIDETQDFSHEQSIRFVIYLQLTKFMTFARIDITLFYDWQNSWFSPWVIGEIHDISLSDRQNSQMFSRPIDIFFSNKVTNFAIISWSADMFYRKQKMFYNYFWLEFFFFPVHL